MKKLFELLRIDETDRSLAGLIDLVTRRIDNFIGSTIAIKYFHNRSLLAFLLPLPVFIFILSGPSENPFPMRGGLGTISLVTGVFLIQLLYFLFIYKKPWRCMAWLQFGLVVILAAVVCCVADFDSKQASADLYWHYYAFLSPIVMLIAIPVAWLLKRRIIFSPAKETMEKFSNSFDVDKVVAKVPPRKFHIMDGIRAYFTVILRKPLHVIAPAALYVVFVTNPRFLAYWVVASVLLVFLILMATSIYDPHKNTLVSIIQRIFLSGASLIVTLFIIILAVLRIADYSYVTYLMDSGSKNPLIFYIISTYCLLWFYDFWVNQAILDLVLKNSGFDNHENIIRHGGGRIAVIKYIDNKKRKKRIFEPTAFLMRIAQTSGKDENELIGEVKRAQQKFRLFASLCLILLSIIFFLSYKVIRGLEQVPGLDAQTTGGGDLILKIN